MAGITEKISRRKATDEEAQSLLNEIYLLSEQLERAYERFDQHSDSLLIDATIYEIEALKARYSYLLALAEQKNLKAEKRRA